MKGDTFASQVINELDSSPEKWEMTKFRIKHRKNGISMWIGNGLFFIEADEDSAVSRKFSLLEKIRIWFAFYRWNKRPVSLDQAQQIQTP